MGAQGVPQRGPRIWHGTPRMAWNKTFAKYSKHEARWPGMRKRGEPGKPWSAARLLDYLAWESVFRAEVPLVPFLVASIGVDGVIDWTASAQRLMASTMASWLLRTVFRIST